MSSNLSLAGGAGLATRREATKKLLETHDTNYCYVLYRQEITTTGELEWVKNKTLEPYPTKELVKAGLVVKGVDYDIDKERV